MSKYIGLAPLPGIAAVLVGAGLAYAQETPASAINDIAEKAAISANITGSPPERPIWLKFWPQPAFTPPPLPPGSKPPVRDPRDFNGAWLQPKVVAYLHRVDSGTLGAGAREDGFPPFRPDAEKIFNYFLKSNSDGKPIAEAAEYCRPQGIPRALIPSAPQPHQIIQRPDRMWQIFGQRQRVLYLDRDHPRDLKTSYMGHSTGRWEGNTLVVDTIGFNARTTRLDRVGSPHGPKLHVIERYTKAEDGSSMGLDMLIDDPDFYTQPFTINLKLIWWNPALGVFGPVEAGASHCEDSPHAYIIGGVFYQGVRPPSAEDRK